MISGVLKWGSVPVSLVTGVIGAIVVIKAVSIERRELKRTCAGGATKVPLGLVSLTDKLMMIGMAICTPPM